MEWMRVRVLLIASLSGAVVFPTQRILAQDHQAEVHELPPVEVSAPTTSGAKRGRSQSAARSARRPLTRVYVSTTPVPSAKVDADTVPSGTSVVDSRQIERTGSLNIADALRQSVPGVNISEVAGNPFQPDIEFRGFVASPVAGTPQGLAVYQNGVRINEAFGDTVNWDLIPTAAIQSVTVVNNPAFGLNALGGAVNVQMKDGFNYHGAEINTMAGSFGRIQSSAQWGKQIDGNYAVYGALEGLHDDGFRNFSPSDIKRFYGDVGYRNDGNEFHLNMGLADNRFGASATVPVELLQQYWGATYTTPQTSTNQVGYLNLTGKVEASPTWTIDGTAHVRAFDQNTVDGNPTSVQACADQTLLCFGDNATPANGLNGAQLANPFSPDAVLGEIDRTSTRSTTAGFSLQATNTDQIFGHDNRFVVGGAFDASVTHFNASAELGTIGSNFVVSGSGIYLGASGDPTMIGPVSLRTTNQYSGLYLLDTFDVTRAFSITAGGRFNDARISLQDQLGTALNGDHTYDRFNPTIGATYKITPEFSAYAGYSEANRAPTPLELGCADPAHPCIIGAFLVSDPPLKQVVSRTIEAGLRGSKELNIGTLDWKLGGFRATNTDDIMAIPSQIQGFGYFQNVGSTRRQGLEAEAKLKSSAFELYASYALVDARFLDALQVGSNSPFADANGNIQILPGNVIPGVPRHRIKAGIDYSITDALKVGGDALFVSSQYYVGDGSNQAPQLPSYAVFNLHASYQVDKNVQIYGRIDNVFDNRYATYGTFFDRGAIGNLSNGTDFTDARTVSPARPRAFYAGMKVTF
jgi:outer membrane receptor protein involved in Fe transport